MLQAAILGERTAHLVEVPDPAPTGEWVVVKVLAAPLCTEYKAFLAGECAGGLGHEAAGEVVAVAQPGPVQVGDRVVAMPLSGCGRCPHCVGGDYIYCAHNPMQDATLAQYVLKPAWLLQPIPAGVPYERAALACCGLGPSFGAFQAMRVRTGDTVLITGAGPVGLGAIVNARFRDTRVIVVESNPWRVARAQQMGVAAVIDPRAVDPVTQICER